MGRFTRAGFTLVELLIVVAIVGLLSSSVAIAMRGKTDLARDGVRKANLRSIAGALETYFVDHNNNYPPDPLIDDSTQFISTGSGSWIPGLAPDQIKTLPKDPKQAGIISHLAYLLEGALRGVLDQDFRNLDYEQAYAQASSPLVASENQICSLLGANQQSVGIAGQDGGTSILAFGKSYWTFGDTMAPGGVWPFIPNNIASSTDFEASDCLLMTTKSSSGQATALLPTVSGELTVWPDGMAYNGNPFFIHFYYISVRICSNCSSEAFGPSTPFKVQGIGLAKFYSSMGSIRIGNCSPVSNCLFWHEGGGYGFQIAGATAIVDGDYVYIFLNESPNGVDQVAVRLARVLKTQIEDKNAYQYWNGSSWVGSLTQSARIMEFGGYFNGVSVAYNSFLAKWTAVYTTDNFTKVAIISAIN